MIVWLIKAYGRSGSHMAEERLVYERRVPRELLSASVLEALAHGACEMLVIEVKPAVKQDKKRTRDEGERAEVAVQGLGQEEIRGGVSSLVAEGGERIP
jgi:hypothetical protein